MKYSFLYKEALLKDVIPFWEKHSIDYINGGYNTSLTRRGVVYDCDKFMWLQARQAWTFSMLYNQVEKNERWLDFAKIGIDFIKQYGMDNQGNFYFSLTSDGRPLVYPYNIFSDCFAAMAFAQYYSATNNKEIKALAIQTFYNILQRRSNPKGVFEKNAPTRPLKGLALPMILSHLVLELEPLLNRTEVENMVSSCVKEVMDLFLDKESGLIYEFVKPNGEHENSFQGRLLNPGHGIEAMWFMIDIGNRNNNMDLVFKATESIVKILEYSWDRKYGGIFYFLDAKKYPSQQLEWDQKLWWVHLEALIALAKAYEKTSSKDVLKWFIKVHEYTWERFPDKVEGEWFGYLNRRGKVLLDLKGGKFKGCYHLPRALYQCWKTLEKVGM